MARIEASTTNTRALASGEAALQAGVSTDTLRVYERRGLLPAPARDANGYRRYSPAAIERVRIIQAALDAGFTLAELSRILRQRDEGGAPCREVFSIASARLSELNDRIAALSALRDRLERTIGDWERTLAVTPRGARARLLDGLAALPIPNQHAHGRRHGAVDRRAR
ncbi:MAG TPA: MerR family transcriptional regulator [Vicinamibacterales bacterium]|nr:MerR family transcriptional regulator [Vicinamibacterales bacterium]